MLKKEFLFPDFIFILMGLLFISLSTHWFSEKSIIGNPIKQDQVDVNLDFQSIKNMARLGVPMNTFATLILFSETESNKKNKVLKKESILKGGTVNYNSSRSNK